MTKSPFLIFQEFLSPMLCEEVIDGLDFIYPNTNPEGSPVKTAKGSETFELVVFEKFSPYIKEIEKYYTIEHRGTEPMLFEWYPQGCSGENPHCENSEFTNNKWTKVRDRDFTCVIFLSNYQEKTPFDSEFEVYGGKLEFPQHNFGFNPQRGTIVIFPSDPHFINNTTPILAGDLFQIRFHFVTKQQFQYDKEKFKGDYTVWFDSIA